MSSEVEVSSQRFVSRLWRRISDWLGIDRSDPVDLLTTDPVRHFQEWDRNNPDRYWG